MVVPVSTPPTVDVPVVLDNLGSKIATSVPSAREPVYVHVTVPSPASNPPPLMNPWSVKWIVVVPEIAVNNTKLNSSLPSVFHDEKPISPSAKEVKTSSVVTSETSAFLINIDDDSILLSLGNKTESEYSFVPVKSESTDTNDWEKELIEKKVNRNNDSRKVIFFIMVSFMIGI